ncbi:response regulator [Ectothiorhodospiraceae bacterium BW-2]|nr:response regulator [Ectothiorhodospiraceae bacterium BW-2]
MAEEKILIVDDDLMFQGMLQALLKSYRLKVVASGEEALAEVEQFAPKLILLDINMEGMDGYETCRQLRQREVSREVPVIFISNMVALEDRMQAFGAGGNDYIGKPPDSSELIAKVEKMLQLQGERHRLQQELQQSYSLIMDLQQESSNLQSVSRFMQAGLFCHDLNDLFTLFFRTTRELGIGCALKLLLPDDHQIRADNGSISRLEREILEMAESFDRIYSFGHGRALFNWQYASLLVRNATDKLDIIAILMDGLNASMKAIVTENSLLEQVQRLESDNGEVKDRIYDLFQEMNISLKEAILSLGVTSLTMDEEDKLNDLIDLFNGKINQQMDRLSQNNQGIFRLINELRQPPPELEELLRQSHDSEQQESGGIAFF